MDSIIDASPSDWKYSIARFVRAFVDLELFAAERKHLGHKGHTVELSIMVERAQYLIFAPDFYPVTYFQLLLLLFNILSVRQYKKA
jgi:hypothetical protein